MYVYFCLWLYANGICRILRSFTALIKLSVNVFIFSLLMYICHNIIIKISHVVHTKIFFIFPDLLFLLNSTAFFNIFHAFSHTIFNLFHYISYVNRKFSLCAALYCLYKNLAKNGHILWLLIIESTNYHHYLLLIWQQQQQQKMKLCPYVVWLLKDNLPGIYWMRWRWLVLFGGRSSTTTYV